MRGKPVTLRSQNARHKTAKFDRIVEVAQSLGVRMSAVGGGMTALIRRGNRVGDRLDLIEKRLDLAEAPH